MILGFTGTQYGMTDQQKRGLKYILIGIFYAADIRQAHHGDCIGADAEFHQIISSYINTHLCMRNSNKSLIDIKIHPPIIETKRAFCQPGSYDEILPAKDYLPRNMDIAKASDIILATPKEMKEVVRSGTWTTIRYGRDMDKRVIIVHADGSIGE